MPLVSSAHPDYYHLKGFCCEANKLILCVLKTTQNHVSVWVKDTHCFIAVSILTFLQCVICQSRSRSVAHSTKARLPDVAS